MKNLLFLLSLLFLLLFNCNTKKTILVNNTTKYDVLNQFFNQIKANSYLDKHMFDRNMIELFNGKYSHHKRIFIKSDSICRNSNDTLKLKISCPLANNFREYRTILNDNDLSFLLKQYNREGEMYLLNFDSITKRTTLQKHSIDYYNKIEYDKYRGLDNLNEFPSIRIENLYFTKNKDLAIIAYSIVESSTQISTNFYILKKTNENSWKSIGDFKI